MSKTVLISYDFDPQACTPEKLSSGLINITWRVNTDRGTFILQRINTQVFKEPQSLMKNLARIAAYLKQQHPDYLFVAPLANRFNDFITYDNEGSAFRLFPFIANATTINKVSHPEQAYEAALQFGKFTTLLHGFDSSTLYVTIPDFHNLGLRFQQFEHAITHGNRERIAQAAESIRELRKFTNLVEQYKHITTNPQFIKRVTHHDTKISNVLFDASGKGLCVIDLDTVMPGYFISDVGDMLRTYLSPVTEEERDTGKIAIRENIFRAIAAGYLEYMGDELTTDELDHFLYAGQFITYMQALRFMTDYISNDPYYGAKYENHNFDRANNQLRLLRCMNEQAPELQSIIKKEWRKKTA